MVEIIILCWLQLVLVLAMAAPPLLVNPGMVQEPDFQDRNNNNHQPRPEQFEYG